MRLIMNDSSLSTNIFASTKQLLLGKEETKASEPRKKMKKRGDYGG
jgi:hypothetical protein